MESTTARTLQGGEALCSRAFTFPRAGTLTAGFWTGVKFEEMGNKGGSGQKMVEGRASRGEGRPD